MTSIHPAATIDGDERRNSFQIGRFLVIVGIVLVVLGLIVMAGSKFSFFGLGRLPGDIAYKGKNFQFYFPIVTCLIVSAA